ncbi:hypothetical protein K3495_g15923 [Podosphaera aphanis]|nr:hypothetical protein K3495_g15923 [Podosphaera aphanis]
MGAPGEFPDSTLLKDLEEPRETDFSGELKEATSKNDKGDQKQHKTKDKAESSEGEKTAVDQSTLTQKKENPAPSSNTSTSDQARRPNGKLNLFRNIDPYQDEMTEQERYVKDIWPEAKLESEIYYTNSDGCSNRNKVNLKPEWKLSVTDQLVESNGRLYRRW